MSVSGMSRELNCTSTDLIRETNSCICCRVVFCRVGVLTVRKLDLGVIFDLVEENYPSVRQKTGVHSWNAGLANDNECARVRRRWSW